MPINLQAQRRPFVNSGFELVNKNALNTDGSIFNFEYAKKAKGICGSSLIGYWPIWDIGSVAQDFSGTAKNGAHTAVTLGQPGIGDGRMSGLYNGTTSFTNIYSAALATAFNGSEGTLHISVKMRATSVWTDAALRRLVNIYVDASNYAVLGKSSTNNTLVAAYRAGGTDKSLSTSVMGGSTDWFEFGLIWSFSGDYARAFINGAQYAEATGLGSWTGTPGTMAIGATNTTPIQITDGFLAHTILCNAALSPAAIAELARVN